MQEADILHQVIERHQNDWLAKSQEAMRDVCYKLVALAVALLVMQLIVATLKRRHRHRTFERMQIPGPEPNLMSGHLYESRRQPYVQFAHKMHEQFGKTVGVYLGGDPYLLTKDLDLIQQVFVAKSRHFYDRMNFYLNVDPVPDNLICQRGNRWRYMRKLLTPAFSHSKIKSSYLYRDSQETVKKFMRQLEDNSSPVEGQGGGRKWAGGESGQVTFVEDLYDRMAAIALDVIVKTAFHMDNMISFSGPLSGSTSRSKPLAGDGDCRPEAAPERRKVNCSKQDGFLSTAKQACRLAFNPLVELIFCFPFLNVPLTYLCNHLYFGSIIQLLFDRLDYLVRQSDTKAKVDAPDGPHRRRIIDSLIEVLRDKKISKSEFTGNAFVIVFAGFETTANALTFTLWLLAKHQQVQDKLRARLREQMGRLGRTSGRHEERDQPDYENNVNDIELAELASGCEYLEMVLNESLRLFPPVPGLSCRQASSDCRLADGLRVERGVNVVPSVFSIHRDKTIWGEAANEFEPERFETLDVSQLNSAMFMPFGLGPRNCIGKALAMQEMKIVIGRLVLEYSIQFWPGVTPEELRLCSPINITITSADKIGLKFVKLSNK